MDNSDKMYFDWTDLALLVLDAEQPDEGNILVYAVAVEKDCDLQIDLWGSNCDDFEDFYKGLPGSPRACSYIGILAERPTKQEALIEGLDIRYDKY